MVFGNFTVTECGAFDSNVKFPGKAESPNRLVEDYELELYTEQKNSCSYINGRALYPEAGSVLCAKPGQTRHSKLPFRCRYLHLRTADDGLKAFLNALPDVMQFPGCGELNDIFQGILQECADYFTERPSAYRLAQHVYALFAFLDAHTSHGTVTPDVLPGSRQADMLAISEYIRDHIGEKLSLEQLAAKVNLSPVYFHKLFSNYYDKTPGQYVFESRIAAAKLLLISTDLPIGTVAERCGFATQNYFNTCFKKATGQSPLRYRKTMLSQGTL